MAEWFRRLYSLWIGYTIFDSDRTWGFWLKSNTRIIQNRPAENQKFHILYKLNIIKPIRRIPCCLNHPDIRSNKNYADLNHPKIRTFQKMPLSEWSLIPEFVKTMHRNYPDWRWIQCVVLTAWSLPGSSSCYVLFLPISHFCASEKMTIRRKPANGIDKEST